MEDGKRKQCRDEGTELVLSFGLPCQFLFNFKGRWVGCTSRWLVFVKKCSILALQALAWCWWYNYPFKFFSFSLILHFLVIFEIMILRIFFYWDSF